MITKAVPPSKRKVNPSIIFPYLSIIKAMTKQAIKNINPPIK